MMVSTNNDLMMMNNYLSERIKVFQWFLRTSTRLKICGQTSMEQCVTHTSEISQLWNTFLTNKRNNRLKLELKNPQLPRGGDAGRMEALQGIIYEEYPNIFSGLFIFSITLNT